MATVTKEEFHQLYGDTMVTPQGDYLEEAVSNLIVHHKAHLVLPGSESDYKAARYAWKSNPANWQECIQHVVKGYTLGIVPWSVGCTVLDIDIDGDMTPEEFWEAEGAFWNRYPPMLWARSPNGIHYWYNDTEPRSNGRWQIDGLQGDIRGGAGYVLMYGATPSRLDNQLQVVKEGVYDPRWFPQALIKMLPAAKPLPAPNWQAIDRIDQKLDNRERYIARVLRSAGLNPDVREDWIRVGMALTHSVKKGEVNEDWAKTLWSGWSRQSSKYNQQDQDYQWRYLMAHDHANPVTMGTLVASARTVGGLA